ncbi:hypothetical protein [Streptomyces sp. SP18CS02]|uniref:hypothetical protein n=1 Tax=Streptomyces sp. SP18CS02 TaxID=3002531 RepID=UPI002E7991BA|nr:hypothetical protein [Streptomyces sp. SP18CS02]MEE1752846.1 hypothetical protein [Streptomyces sp. SP18CS02]
MRVLMKVQMDTRITNEALKRGTLQKTMQSALETIRPEAAYFGTEDGCRTAYIVFDLEAPFQMPKIAEPFFMELGAKIWYTPVMDREDLGKGLAALMRDG